ncbi:DUF2304 domain-containing protein [Candidatus Giovannonibacteria bacterium]|nr:DUF2304 domain-containing protein [Candidatus Giovannonibacteria bacterium]
MDYIQLITAFAAILVIANLFSLLRRREIGYRRFFAWLVLWLGVAFFTFYPQRADFFASKLGIDRGTDLALFGAVILIFYIILKIFVRLERIERNITKLVRGRALAESEKHSRE